MKKIINLINQYKVDILLLVLVILVGTYSLRLTFRFGLYGDDWQHLYSFMKYQSEGLLSPSLFYSAYGGQMGFLQLIRIIFGLDPIYYFISSFLLRSLAAISIYFVAKYFTTSRMMSFCASLIWIIGFTGIETTTWVLTSNTYLSIFLVVIYFYLVYKYFTSSTNNSNLKKYILLLLFQGITIIATPIRMHGIVILTPLIESLFLISHLYQWKKSVLRLVLFLVMIFVFQQNGVFGLLKDTKNSSFDGAISIFKSYESTNLYVKNNLITFANLYIPQSLFQHDNVLLKKITTLVFDYKEISALLLIYLLITKFTFVVRVKNLKHITIFLLILFAGLIWVMKQYNSQLGVNGVLLIFSILFIFIQAILIYKLYEIREINKLTVQLALLLTTFAFFFIPQLYAPLNPITSASRYLTVPYAFSVLLLTYSIYTLCYLNKDSPKYQKLTIFIFSGLVLSGFAILQHTSLQSYLSESLKTRNAIISSRIYKEINQEYKRNQSQGLVFYFQYDDFVLYSDAVQFGGSYRIAVENNVLNALELPAYLSEKAALLEMVEKEQLYPSKLDKIISFKIKNGDVENISDQIRTEIRKSYEQ